MKHASIVILVSLALAGCASMQQLPAQESGASQPASSDNSSASSLSSSDQKRLQNKLIGIMFGLAGWMATK